MHSLMALKDGLHFTASHRVALSNLPVFLELKLLRVSYWTCFYLRASQVYGSQVVSVLSVCSVCYYCIARLHLIGGFKKHKKY